MEILENYLGYLIVTKNTRDSNTKGQLISEWNFCVFKSPKKPNFIGQKSVKNLVGFLGDLKTPKFKFWG